MIKGNRLNKNTFFMRYRVRVLLIFMMMSGMLFLISIPAKANPKIDVKDSFFDFGSINQQQTVKHGFTLSNTGKETLIIEDIRTTCSCTKTKLIKKELKPGEKEELEVFFESGFYTDTITQRVYIHSNDPDSPVIKVTIIADVIEEIELTPHLLYFTDMVLKKPSLQKMTLKNASSSPLKISGIDIKDKGIARFIDFDFEPSKDKGFPIVLETDESTGISVTATLKAEPDQPHIQCELVLKTDNARTPEIPIWIRANIQSNPKDIPTFNDVLSTIIEEDGKADLELFAMSMCPYTIRAENTIAKAMADYKDKIRLKIYFIAGMNSTDKKGVDLFSKFNSLHKEPEVKEDIIQTVIQDLFPEKLTAYLAQRNTNIRDRDWEKYAKRAGIDLDRVNQAIKQGEAEAFFQKNIKMCYERGIKASPTLFINGKRVKVRF